MDLGEQAFVRTQEASTARLEQLYRAAQQSSQGISLDPVPGSTGPIPLDTVSPAIPFAEELAINIENASMLYDPPADDGAPPNMFGALGLPYASDTGLAESERIKQVAAEMEAMVLNLLLKQMWATVNEGTLFGGTDMGTKMYREMWLEETARDIAHGPSSIGIAGVIERELTPKHNVYTPQEMSGLDSAIAMLDIKK